MSSLYVRNQIKTFITTEMPTETLIDLSGEYAEISDMIADAGLTPSDPWLGIQFIGNEEVPIGLAAGNTTGKYREVGAVYIHIVDIAKLGGTSAILTRAEALRDKLRGQRIGSIIVESVSPPNFDEGGTLRFEGGYMSASFLLSYERDLDL